MMSDEENITLKESDVKAFFVSLFGEHETVHLTAITPKGKLSGFSAKTTDEELYIWIRQHNKTSNIYFTVNQVAPDINKPKPNKQDIVGIRAVWVDLDPDKKKHRNTERKRLRALVDKMNSGTAIIDTGNGYAVFWKIRDGGKKYIEAELIGQKLAKKYGGDHVHNVDRLMRVPGTINYPTPKKLEAGYDIVQSSLVEARGTSYTMAELENVVSDIELVNIVKDDVVTARDLEDIEKEKVWERFQQDLHNEQLLAQRWNGDTDGLEDTSRNGLDMSMVNILKSIGYKYNEVVFILHQQSKDKTKVHEKPEEYIAELWRKTKATEPLDVSPLREYCYVADQNKFLHLYRKTLVTHSAFDIIHGDIYTGHNKRPTACNAFKRDKEAKWVDCLGWRPGEEEIYQDGPLLVANLYQEPTMEGKEGDITPWLEHAQYIIPDHDIRQHIFDWMAWCIQFPEHKINHQILMAGNARIGKDLFWAPFFKYWEHHTVVIGADQLHSDYNGWLINTKIVQVQEIAEFSSANLRARKKDLENSMRAMLTAPPNKLTVNEKYRAPFMIDNVAQFVMFSNEQHAISIRQRDGRYLCIWCGAVPRSGDYYNAYAQWMYNGGDEALLYWLQHRDLSHFNPKMGAPETEYQRQLMSLSRSYGDAIVQEALEDAVGVFAKDIVSPTEAQRHLEARDRAGAGRMLSKAGCIRRRVQVKVDGKHIHQILWCLRNTEAWAEKEDREWWDYWVENRGIGDEEEF